NRYFGKYRGAVVNNVDPMRIGRIQVQVADVTGLVPSTWAMPCVPFAGMQEGVFYIPPIGSGVWVEFEQGNVDYPIWTGGFWGTAAEVPALASATPPSLDLFVVSTLQQNTLLVSDMPGPTGGILLKFKTGAFISISEVGITLNNGQGASIVMARSEERRVGKQEGAEGSGE